MGIERWSDWGVIFGVCWSTLSTEKSHLHRYSGSLIVIRALFPSLHSLPDKRRDTDNMTCLLYAFGTVAKYDANLLMTRSIPRLGIVKRRLPAREESSQS